jgi:hypothetical protein
MRNANKVSVEEEKEQGKIALEKSRQWHSNTVRELERIE